MMACLSESGTSIVELVNHCSICLETRNICTICCDLAGGMSFARSCLRGSSNILRVDSPFFPTIVLFENPPFPWVSGGFLERRIPGKNGEGRSRNMA